MTPFIVAFLPAWSIGSVVHVAWCDNRDGTYQVYYKFSTDAGIKLGRWIQSFQTNILHYFPIMLSGSIRIIMCMLYGMTTVMEIMRYIINFQLTVVLVGGQIHV